MQTVLLYGIIVQYVIIDLVGTPTRPSSIELRFCLCLHYYRTVHQICHWDDIQALKNGYSKEIYSLATQIPAFLKVNEFVLAHSEFICFRYSAVLGYCSDIRSVIDRPLCLFSIQYQYNMPPAEAKNRRNVFVTVGTTRFEKLVAAATSKAALEWMASRGYTSLTVQYGTGQEPKIGVADNCPIAIRIYSFQPSLDEDMRRADLILSHAGAGTVMEALRLQKKLVVVINTLLMDNHQTELAGAMAERNHLFMVEEPEALDDIKTWASFQDFSPVLHVGGADNDFPRLLDSHLGFSVVKED